MNKRYNKGIIATIIVLVAIIVLLLGYIGVNNMNKGSNKNYMGAVITQGKEEEAIDSIEKALDNINNKDILLNVQNGEDSYVTMVYNDKGEIFGQDSENGYISVYLSNGNVVRFNEYVDYGADSDVLMIMQSALKMAKDSKGVILNLVNTAETSDKVSQTIIDIRGWENVTELYSVVSDEFSDTMVEQLKSTLPEENEGDEINFRFIYGTDESSKLVSAACYIYFGDTAPDKVSWEDVGLSWIITSINEVYDWELKKDWYNIEWENEGLDVKNAEELLTDQYNEIMKMLDKWNVDNGGESIYEGNNTGESSGS